MLLPSERLHVSALVLLTLAAFSPVPAQPSGNASVPPAAAASAIPLRPLPDSEEIALAISAAPPPIAELATVVAYKEGRFVEIRKGTNGFTCLVERFSGRSVFPTCYDRDASATYLPGVELRERLVLSGMPYRAAIAAVDSAYRVQILGRPTRGALAFRLSPRMTFLGASGSSFPFDPSIMMLAPFATSMDLGYPSARSAEVRPVIEMGVVNAGKPDAYMTFVVPPPRRPSAPTPR